MLDPSTWDKPQSILEQAACLTPTISLITIALRTQAATLDSVTKDSTTVLSISSSPEKILEAHARDHLYLPNNKSRT
jgi:hypothetical protein